MGPHQGTVEGEENLPRPAGHTPLNVPQDLIGLLGNQGTLLAYGPEYYMTIPHNVSHYTKINEVHYAKLPLSLEQP